VIIWGDDIGQSNVSAYSHGQMGYRTPNIDRIASEGMMFTDYYGEQSCTAGRAAFVTGQSVFRTGLSKVGMPGAETGLSSEDVTIAELLRSRGYVTEGYDFLPYLTRQTDTGPRTDFFYFSDDGDLTGLRYDNWKLVFAEQRARGTLRVWAEPYTALRVPKMFNLRTDPYERADVTSNTYYDWALEHAFLLVPAQAYVANFLGTFKQFPPRQKAASFTVDQVMEKLESSIGSH